MKTHLKIKLISLAEEIRIIKREKRRWNNPLWVSLDDHQHLLSRECRSAALAYGYLRGREYWKLEAKCFFPPNWEQVEYHVRRFGDGFVKGKPIDVERDVM